MYTPRLLKITAANILIFIIKKQTVIKHSKIAGRRVFGLSYLSVNYAVKHSSVQTKCLNGC